MRRLSTLDPGFAQRFRALAADTRTPPGGAVAAETAAILADVRQRGFAAVAELTRRFDGVELDEAGAAIAAGEVDEAAARAPAALAAALALAARRIAAFHEAQRPADGEQDDGAGTRAGWRWQPVGRAGLYVPGGRAAYPSSLLMNAIPARVAGVADIVLCLPTPGGALAPAVALAARLAGVSRLFRIGGAQAIAAMAWGVGPVPRCDVVAGPGNAWVAEAKRQLFGEVGIDMVAGPSEILVIADASAHPAWVAADLLGQAEHDPLAQAVLLTPEAALADAVVAEVNAQLASLGRTARDSWETHGLVIETRDLAEAVELSNALAPEHLELMVAEPRALLPAVRAAGSVFLGHHTPEAVGDYVGGPNHVLPTGRRARFSGGLSVHHFMVRSTWLDVSPAGLERLGPAAITLAEHEGLPAHARSVALRLQR